MADHGVYRCIPIAIWEEDIHRIAIFFSKIKICPVVPKSGQWNLNLAQKIGPKNWSKVASHGFGKVKIIFFAIFWCILNLEKSIFDPRRPFS